ncbi:glycerol-3-phosphate dehydrogenase [Neorhizobium galegae]|uniref:Glycerol-3-phosphate dehydrogenase n=1 Tax=Neorhizobium galegae bv. orientalis str. HAMBI 540 TaxID=1028800 RepID=A0A068SJT4_NEOGA|nr:glycerol-3-phosphate dehydrogenase [Neorhizobium galegae]CDN46327.1 Glycerol-3-phosphate dehydrogenase [Neorhizobium galegae bv. orientalis str. HAMBI 540]
MGEEIHDIFVIGGGINGCGIARDAAGRGYSVALAEMDDFASGTSSGATKLIHGGLRYLEHYEFRLVRESLMERETLWAMAPHIIWPLRFVLPYHKGGIRPAWLIRLGLFLYDHLGGRKLLPPTAVLDMRTDPAGKPLKPLFTKAFEYSDGWVDDARMVVLNARDAADRGALILPRTRVVAARREGGLWMIETVGTSTGRAETYKARMLVNAAGPWVDQVIREALGNNDARHVRLVQGSHIVVKKKFEGSRAYFFQNRDNRIIFAIPYENDFTLIGTTDRDYSGNPKDVKISEEETTYLCNAASEYFRESVRPADIVWTYSAVRPLFDDGASKAQEATRDYVLKLDDTQGAPLLNVFGGKLTTYRRLSEHALEKIAEAIGAKGRPWTAKSHLPGGDFAAQGYEQEVAKLKARYPFLEERHARRLVRRYGTRAGMILDRAAKMEDLGHHFGGDLYEAEVKYLIDREWAMSAQDVLWRRTKDGLRLSETEKEYLEEYMAAVPAKMAG